MIFPAAVIFELNTFAEERALDKQRQALDAVYYDRAAAHDLKRLIAFPASAEPGTPLVVLPAPIEGSLADDKVDVLTERWGSGTRW